MSSEHVLNSAGVRRSCPFSGSFLSCSGRSHLVSFPPKTLPLTTYRRRWKRNETFFSSKPSSPELSTADEEWLKKLPEKKKPLYSHSLPCIEAWLKKLGFYQSTTDPAIWFIERLDWHAQLSLDVTDLHIRYLKTGPGNLDKDVDRRFSYALSRYDIENAIFGGP